MLLLLLVSATSPALALDSTHLVSIGEEITHTGGGGSWARVFSAEAPDWHFLHAGGGDYHRRDMTEDLVISDKEQAITGRDDLDDYAVTPCATGGYMMLSSAGLTVDNDSGYLYRLDDGFNVVAEAVLAESDPQKTYNDMAVICGDDGAIATFSNFPTNELMLVRIEDSGAVRSVSGFTDMPNATGCSLVSDPRTGDVLLVGADGHANLAVARFTWDLSSLGSPTTVLQAEDPNETMIYWPQATQAVGDRFLVAYVRQDASDGFNQDWGHIRLAIFDADWNLLEDHQVTDAAPPDGSMRPGLAVRDDVLIVSYDRIIGSPGQVLPRLRSVRLDLGAFQDPDTGTTDTAGPTDSGGPGDSQPTSDSDSGASDSGSGDSGDDQTRRCGGCSDDDAPAPPSAALLLFGLVPWRRRMRLAGATPPGGRLGPGAALREAGG